jgi:hypothetical protein
MDALSKFGLPSTHYGGKGRRMAMLKEIALVSTFHLFTTITRACLLRGDSALGILGKGVFAGEMVPNEAAPGFECQPLVFMVRRKGKKWRTPTYAIPHYNSASCVFVAGGFHRFVQGSVRRIEPGQYFILGDECDAAAPEFEREDNDDVDQFLSEYHASPATGILGCPIFSKGVTLGRNEDVDLLTCMPDSQMSGAIRCVKDRCAVLIPALKGVVKVQHLCRVGSSQASQMVNPRRAPFLFTRASLTLCLLSSPSYLESQ